jgi:hypothetical protein
MVILPFCILFVLLAVMVVFGLGFWTARQFQLRTNAGEVMVADEINSGFRRPHKLFNNVTIASDDGTAQIDHILVADTGIFVIETKHYSGWIFGRPNDRYWTQTIFKTKFRFLNPLHQNYGHVKALQALFTLPESAFIPIVVFTGTAEFKTEVGPSVLMLHQLLPELSSERPVVFDEKKMTYIVGRIEMKRLRRSIETDEYHRQSVRRRVQERMVAGV